MARPEPLLDEALQPLPPELAGQQRRGVLGGQPGQPRAQPVVQARVPGQLVEQLLPGGQARGGTDAGADEGRQLPSAGSLAEVPGQLL